MRGGAHAARFRSTAQGPVCPDGSLTIRAPTCVRLGDAGPMTAVQQPHGALSLRTVGVVECAYAHL